MSDFLHFEQTDQLDLCVCVYIYIYIYTHIQGVPGEMCQTSGECSLG